MTDAKIDPAHALATAGNTGLKHSGGRVVEEYARNLKGRKLVETLQEMGDSPLVGAVLLLIEMLTRQVEPIVVASPTKHPESDRQAEILRGMLDDMDTPWRQVVGEHVAPSAHYGWARSEIIYKIRRGPDANLPELRSDFSDGLYGLRDLSPRSQDSLDTWEFDDEGKVVAMNQTIVGGQGSWTVPEAKMLAVIPRPYKRSPEGRSFLRPGVRSWTYARNIEDSEALGIERDLTGVPLVTVPLEIMAASAGSDAANARADWEDKVRKLKRGKLDGLLMPAAEERGEKTGYSAQLMASGGTGRINPDQAIRRHESRLLISLMCEFFVLGVDGVGARAVADPKINQLNLVIGALLDVFYDSFTTKVVADLMRLNGVPDEYWPTVTHGPIDAPDLPELVDMLTKMTGANIVLPSEDLQRWVLSQIPGAPTEITEAPPAPSPEDDMSIAVEPKFSADQLATLMSASEVKSALSLGTVGLRRLIDEGKLAAYRVNGRWKFDPSAVRDLLTASAHTVDSAPDGATLDE